MFGSHEKIKKCKNQSLANVTGIRQHPARNFDRIRLDQWPDPVISGRILAVLARLAGIQQYSGRNLVHRWPDSVASWIQTTGCCQTPRPTGFRRPTIAKF
jgi:hypothetical protein